MPANISKVQHLLDTELEKKVADAPLELRSVESLFSENGSFKGPNAFFTVHDDDTKQGSSSDIHIPGNNTVQPPITVSDEVTSLLKNEKKNTHLFAQISQEEVEDITQKLTLLVNMPPGQLDSESELYLEQQLSDMLGLQLSSEIEGHRLLYNTGKVKALPHIKLHPTDTISSHTHQYAQLSDRRGSYGWFLEQGKVSEESENLEKFYCALPLYFFSQWQSDYKATKKWYKHRKVLFINPLENMAVVCAVGTIAPNTQSRYQFGASPEAIISGKFWSPRAAGKVLVLFVEDADSTIQLGPRKLFKEL